MGDYVARALRGDHEAFSQLYDRYGSAALRLSMAITGSPDLAADAVQEAFLRVYQKGGQYRKEAKFEPWFFRIVINESRRVLRRQPRAQELIGAGEEPSFAEQINLSVTIAAALERLSQKHRTVLVLRFLMDYSEREIASMIRKPVGTVKSRLHYAKLAMARELDGKEA